jgi:hypothetical protein
VGEGDFTIAAWIHPGKQKRQGIVSLGNAERSQGWFLELLETRGPAVRFQTAGRDAQANATVTTPAGAIREDAWQHVAVVVKRGRNDTRIYVNGVLVARAATGSAQFDDEQANLQIGRTRIADSFNGELADVRLYNRPLEEGEIQGLVQPGRALVKAPPERKTDVTLQLGNRQFIGTLRPAFLVVRLDPGALAVSTKYAGVRALEKITLTPLAAGDELAKKFGAFEKRFAAAWCTSGTAARLRQYVAPVGPAQTVSSEQPAKYVFEGAIRNFPSPESEKDDNVNYLQGLREIGVHSEYTDGRDMPRLVIRSVEFEGPYYDVWPPASHTESFSTDGRMDQQTYAHKIIHDFATRAYRRPITPEEERGALRRFPEIDGLRRRFKTV